MFFHEEVECFAASRPVRYPDLAVDLSSRRTMLEDKGSEPSRKRSGAPTLSEDFDIGWIGLLNRISGI